MKQVAVTQLWTALHHQSMELCHLTKTGNGYEVNSVIVGLFETGVCKIEYSIHINLHWETTSFEIKTAFNGQNFRCACHSNGNGSWWMNGEPVDAFRGCRDIDISLTPFTNSLPINRLKLGLKENAVIKVLYIDVLSQKIKAVQQKYSRLSETEYKYENVPNDFEAVLTVDPSGFVRNYPNLFVRTAIQQH